MPADKHASVLIKCPCSLILIKTVMSQHVTETPQILWKSIKHSPDRHWKDNRCILVTLWAMWGNKEYFGFMGKPWPQWDWSMQDLSSHKLLAIMPRNTCQLLLKHIHADDITTTNTSDDHLYKLQPVHEILTGMFKNNYIPQTQLHLYNSM